MHTTSLYPTSDKLVNLGSIKQMYDQFKNIQIGYSDHSLGNTALLSAICLGANIVEKHYVDTMKRRGPDVICSMDEKNLKSIIQTSNRIFFQKKGLKNFNREEQVTRNFAFTSVVANKDILKGSKISSNDLCMKRPGTGYFGFNELGYIIGKKAKKNIKYNYQLKNLMSKKKIVFVTGTRADYGKIKSIINILKKDFSIYIYVTGMHMLPKYGNTNSQILKENLKSSKITLYKNQINKNDSEGTIFGRTVINLTKYFKKIRPDLLLVHGDRFDSLAATIAASTRNILIAHIEGGELSGNIDEHIRHAISKLSHLHFVANENAKKNLIQMGERNSSIFVTGSPDIDIMNSKNLPHIDIVKKRYNIKFDDYGIAILHPFKFNEKKKYIQKINIFLKTLKSSDKNYIIIYPNNDKGNDEIIKIYKKHSKITNFKLIRSMRFEYFLTLLKNSDFIIGNSSVGVREAPFYSIPSINIGERQKNRFLYSSILNVKFDYLKLLRLIKKINKEKYIKSNYFGNGKSDKKILSILKNSNIWKTPHQKQLIIKSIK